MQTVHHLLDIGAPQETVFTALTTDTGLSPWWTTQVKADPAVIGGQVLLTFRGPFNPCLRIAELVSPTHLVWEGVAGHDAWGDTVISFELAAAAAGAQVRFRHRMGTELTDAVASANFSWGYYLNSLRLLCETGNGKPFLVGDPGARVGADQIR